jgi:hypothetical protein
VASDTGYHFIYVHIGANAPLILNKLESPPQRRRSRPFLVFQFDAFSLPLDDLVVLFAAPLSAGENSSPCIRIFLHQRHCMYALFDDKRPTTNDDAWADTTISRCDDALGLQNHLRCNVLWGNIMRANQGILQCSNERYQRLNPSVVLVRVLFVVVGDLAIFWSGMAMKPLCGLRYDSITLKPKLYQLHASNLLITHTIDLYPNWSKWNPKRSHKIKNTKGSKGLTRKLNRPVS